jgi:hypothetical protein
MDKKGFITLGPGCITVVRALHGIHALGLKPRPGNTKGGRITVPLTSCLTGLDLSVLQIKTKTVSSYTADSKPVKQEMNGTVIFPPFSIP